MKRCTDKPYFSFSAYEAKADGLCVTCPSCYKLGIVKTDDEFCYFNCTSCSKQIKEDRQVYIYSVHASCQACGRYFRVQINDKTKQHFKVLNVNCPYCKHRESASIQKVKNGTRYWGEIIDGCEPYFGFPLYYQAVFAGNPIWAINREHLQYLINYIEADLREKPIASNTQSDHLPTFMKRAKNRDGLVKLLKKMQAEL